jgi:hypothetical protein
MVERDDRRSARDHEVDLRVQVGLAHRDRQHGARRVPAAQDPDAHGPDPAPDRDADPCSVVQIGGPIVALPVWWQRLEELLSVAAAMPGNAVELL